MQAARRRNQRPANSQPGLIAIACAFMAMFITTAAAEVGAFIEHHHVVPLGNNWITAAKGAFVHPTDPARAWPVAAQPYAPSASTFWILVISFVSVGLATAYGLITRGAGLAVVNRPPPGFATRAEVRRVFGLRALRSSAQVTRPTNLSRQVPRHQLGVSLGRNAHTGQPLHVSYESSIYLLGPPRCGKTAATLVYNIIDFPGPAVVTSTRDELFYATAGLRPTWLFDPQNSSRYPDRVCWSPIRGCERPATAMRRASVLLSSSGAGKDVTDSSYWESSAHCVLSCLLLAAALGNRTISDVRKWANKMKIEQPQQLLKSRHGPASWQHDLEGINNRGEKDRASVFGNVQVALFAFRDPKVEAACTPDGSAVEFTPERLFEERYTLHLAGDDSQHLAMAPVIVAMVDSILEYAHELVGRSLSGRLDPPLGLFLDEAAHVATLETLPVLLATGGGSGIMTMVVFQSLGQPRRIWGNDGADAMWDAATVKLIYPGLSTREDLDRIVTLCGEIEEPRMSKSRKGGEQWGETISWHTRPTLSTAEIRQQRDWHALLVHRGLPPIQTRQRPWFKGPRAAVIAAAKQELERKGKKRA